VFYTLISLCVRVITARLNYASCCLFRQIFIHVYTQGTVSYCTSEKVMPNSPKTRTVQILEQCDIVSLSEGQHYSVY